MFHSSRVTTSVLHNKWNLKSKICSQITTYVVPMSCCHCAMSCSAFAFRLTDKQVSDAHLLELRLWIDVHVAGFTVECLVLQARVCFSGCSQLALQPGPGEGFDGAVPTPSLQHGFVFGAWGTKHGRFKTFIILMIRLCQRKQNREGWMGSSALMHYICK